MRIDIKPLSVNECWKGRRFKTDKYKAYAFELKSKLKPFKLPKSKLSISITVGFKNSLSDVDNVLKPFLDILQDKYKFNDRDIYELSIRKEVVKKPYIEFEIKEYK